MNFDELIKEVDNIKLHKQRKLGAALKKPLLLLLLISYIQRKIVTENKITFNSIEKELDLLIRNFGGRSGTSKPEQPFHHLNSSMIWELRVPYGVEITNRQTLNKSILRDPETYGYFKPEVFKLLRSSEKNRARLSQYILDKFWPETVQDDIKKTLMLPEMAEGNRRTRDPKFSNMVLANYRNRCAVCGFSAVFNQVTFGVDAAHIFWHAHGGPDTIDNGIALCKLHHWALDRGVITIKPSSFEIIVSPSFVAQETNSIEMLEKVEGKTLLTSGDAMPAREFVKWHRENVFVN